MTCPSCGTENPAGAKFCNECGTALADRTPPALEERKVVSVLFCDLVGFTAASDQLDPEDVRARLRPYHARLRHELEWYGATVEKFVGDAVMAVCGAPVAHEDDAERAVRAGLRILAAIAELNEADPGLGLQVRVGVNTGEAVVSLDARPELGEGIVTGDVVNTAQRIQSAAPVNGVAVGEETYRTTRHVFEYEPLSATSVKGKAEPLPLWRAKAVRIRVGSDALRHHTTPLVGRNLEKPLLIGTFERAAQQRSVQLVTIVGEPGVGKSRMIAELFGYIDKKPELIRWRQGRCLPYGEGITFWALGEIVKAEAAILESDSADVATLKLASVVSPDDPDRQWLLGRLTPLVGVEAGPPAERQELFTAWRRFFESLAAVRPTVLVFEDLHWADEALLAFLEHLAEWSQGVPLLVLCAARPELYERRPGWGAGQRNAHTINLSPLSDDETLELVSHLVRETVVDPGLQRAIVERAGGNPLYAEEFVRLLTDRALERPGDVLSAETPPATVQALIAARLDTLAPERKSLLQDAAVVGKVFWAGAVTEMSGRSSRDVEVTLHELARKELVRPGRTTSMEGEEEYAFWHLLVRDVAYSQIPRAERARRHRAAASWIEGKAGERVEDLAEVLAYHYLQALELAQAAGDETEVVEVVEPARRFLALAGERALGLDTVQAEARLGRALALTAESEPDWPELVVRWADAAFQSGQPRGAADALDQALATLRERGQTEATARALQLRSRLSQRLGEGTHVALAAEAVALLEREPPGAALIAAYEQLANVQTITGAYLEAIEAADRAGRLADALGLPEPARANGYRGFARAYLGDSAGVTQMERALTVLVDRGAGRDAAILENNLAIARYPLAGPHASLRDIERAVEFCEQRGLEESAAQLEANLPGLLIEVGRVEDAFDTVARLEPALDERGDVYTLIEVRSAALSCRVARGEKPDEERIRWVIDTARTIGTTEINVQALAAAAAASARYSGTEARDVLVQLERRTGAPESPYFARLLPGMVRTALAVRDAELATRLVSGLPARYPLEEHALCAARAQLAEDAGADAEAATLYADAAERWRAFGNVPERAYALLGQGRCLVELTRADAAKPLQEARDVFDSMGYRPAVDETDALLLATGVAEVR